MSGPAPVSGPTAAPATAAQSPQDRAALRKAAQGFEAIFVRQMLAAARQAKLGGDDDLLGGQAGDTFAEMRDARFADIAAERGSFGIARQLEAQLARTLPATPAAASAAKD